jgi:hypothetical protein
MKYLLMFLCGTLSIIQTEIAFAGEYNLVLLPSPYCTHAGFETRIGDKYSLGVLGRPSCDSERPTYGSPNAEVRSNFSRVLIPLRYSFKGAFTTGLFVQGMVGSETSEFRSTLGSTANVTFLDLGVYVGYQWFAKSGVNVSVIGGIAYLQQLNASKSISGGESASVTDFLNKNIDSNTHGGAGVIIGWKF